MAATGQLSPSGKGAFAGGAGKWQLAVGYRKQYSHRHFVGTTEQTQRAEEGTEVVNDIHLFDVSVGYQHTPRWSFHFGMPIMFAARTSQYEWRGVVPPGEERTSSANGIGDISLSARAWLFRPPTESRQNIAIGFGVKLPTGRPDVISTVNTPQGPVTRVVDQSIQLGDGGWGYTASADMFKVVKRTTLFATGIYLVNPQNTLSIPRKEGTAMLGARVLSVSDQYLAQTGVIHPLPWIRGGAVSLAGRIEGVPVRDIFGKSDGFRRPGYVISLEPGYFFTRGRNTWSVSVPVPLERNRRRNTMDIATGRHGDAAFADYLVLVGYSRRF